MGAPIRVMLVEDQRTLREGLKLLLEMEGDIQVVAEAEEGLEAVLLAIQHRPDVLIMDVSLVGLDGIEATRRLHAEAPEIAILVLSAHPEESVVRAAMDAGAMGYLVKRAGGAELRQAVRATRDRRPTFSDEVRHVPGGKPRRDGEAARAGQVEAVLTAREIEVLRLVARGHSNREIAELLGLSAKTVDTHRTHLMDKLDIHDVASLTRYAVRKGLVD